MGQTHLTSKNFKAISQLGIIFSLAERRCFNVANMFFIVILVLIQIENGVSQIDQTNFMTDVAKNISMMQVNNEKRDEVVFHLLKTVEKQAQQMEKRDQEIAKRDAILSDLLKEVRSNKETLKRCKEEVEMKQIGDLKRDVRRISEIMMMTMMMTMNSKPLDQCKNFPIRSLYANIRYPPGNGQSKYGPDVQCEWNIQASENVTVTFTRFDIGGKYYSDYVAVYAGESMVGRWHRGQPPVLNLRGDIRIVFRSGSQRSHYRGSRRGNSRTYVYKGGSLYNYGTGFDMTMQPLLR